jgi:hypothetical protein
MRASIRGHMSRQAANALEPFRSFCYLWRGKREGGSCGKCRRGQARRLLMAVSHLLGLVCAKDHNMMGSLKVGHRDSRAPPATALTREEGRGLGHRRKILPHGTAWGLAFRFEGLKVLPGDVSRGDKARNKEMQPVAQVVCLICTASYAVEVISITGRVLLYQVAPSVAQVERELLLYRIQGLQQGVEKDDPAYGRFGSTLGLFLSPT